MPGESGHRLAISALSSRGNLFGCKRLTGQLGVIGGHTGTRNPRLQASSASAPAMESGIFVDRGPGEWVVAPFSANAARTVEYPPIYDDATAASCSQNNPEH